MKLSLNRNIARAAKLSGAQIVKSSFHVERLKKIWTITRDDLIYGEYENKVEALSHANHLAKSEKTDCILHERSKRLVSVFDSDGLAS